VGTKCCPIPDSVTPWTNRGFALTKQRPFSFFLLVRPTKIVDHSVPNASGKSHLSLPWADMVPKTLIWTERMCIFDWKVNDLALGIGDYRLLQILKINWEINYSRKKSQGSEDGVRSGIRQFSSNFARRSKIGIEFGPCDWDSKLMTINWPL